MKTCTRCGRSGPGATVSEGRTICNTCRKGRVPLQLTAVTPRTPQQILADRRAQQAAAAQVKERRAMEDRLESLERELGAVRAIGEGEPLGPIVRMQGKASKSEVLLVALLSDWHVEELVEAEKMHGLNAFDLEIAKQRSEIFFVSLSKLIAAAEKTSVVGRVFLGILGDMFSGSIHLELMELNQLGPGPAAAYARQLLSRGLKFLLNQHPRISFSAYCISGNHGRMTEKSRISTVAENSLEHFMYAFLASDFKDEPRMRFYIAPGDELYAEAFDNYTVRFIHGDQVSFAGGIGGLTIPLNKWVMRQNQSINADLTVLGHWHQCKADRDWVVNGSLIGPTPYSKRFGFAPEPPRQQFILVHSRRGRTSVSDIWCT